MTVENSKNKKTQRSYPRLFASRQVLQDSKSLKGDDRPWDPISFSSCSYYTLYIYIVNIFSDCKETIIMCYDMLYLNHILLDRGLIDIYLKQSDIYLNHVFMVFFLYFKHQQESMHRREYKMNNQVEKNALNELELI